MQFILLVISVASGSILFHRLLCVGRSWLKTRWVKRHGVETKARVLQVEVVNEPGRRVPFIKLMVAVTTADGNNFIGCIDSIVHPTDIPGFTALGQITVRYNPLNISDLQLVNGSQVMEEKTARWEPVSVDSYFEMVQ